MVLVNLASTFCLLLIVRLSNIVLLHNSTLLLTMLINILHWKPNSSYFILCRKLKKKIRWLVDMDRSIFGKLCSSRHPYKACGTMLWVLCFFTTIMDLMSLYKTWCSWCLTLELELHVLSQLIIVFSTFIAFMRLKTEVV